MTPDMIIIFIVVLIIIFAVRIVILDSVIPEKKMKEVSDILRDVRKNIGKLQSSSLSSGIISIEFTAMYYSLVKVYVVMDSMSEVGRITHNAKGVQEMIIRCIDVIITFKRNDESDFNECLNKISRELLKGGY